MRDMQLVSHAELSPDDAAVQAWAHGFAEETIRPTAAANDQDRRQPLDILKSAFEVGLLTLAIPAEFGGRGVSSALTQAIVAEELCWGCIGVYSYFSGTNMFVAALRECGTDDHQRRGLARRRDGGASGGACACTEPGGGADVASIRPRANRVDGGFVLNGQ